MGGDGGILRGGGGRRKKWADRRWEAEDPGECNHRRGGETVRLPHVALPCSELPWMTVATGSEGLCTALFARSLRICDADTKCLAPPRVPPLKPSP